MCELSVSAPKIDDENLAETVRGHQIAIQLTEQ